VVARPSTDRGPTGDHKGRPYELTKSF
jgi:hypothetical protein